MQYIQKIQNAMRGHSKKEIFVWGFYYGFGFEMGVASLLDFLLGNVVDMYIDAFFFVLTLISFLRYRAVRQQSQAIRDLVVLATLTTYALFISSNYHTSIFFTIVPLGYFLLFSLKRSLVYTAIHYLIVLGIYLYGRSVDLDNIYLHDAFILESTFMGALMIVIFGIVYHIAIENSYQQLAASNHQKELLLKEVHHRVKNNLNIVSSMLGLQMLREESPYVQDILAKNKHRIKSIALVHEILYKHEDFEQIDIHEYLGQLSATLLDVYDKDVDVRIEGICHTLPFELALRIGIIANELIVNSIKYAFEGNEPAIRIRIDEDQQNYIMRYEDSCNIPIDTQKAGDRKSLGIRFIDMMVKQLDADISIRNDSGLIYTLWIPKNVH